MTQTESPSFFDLPRETRWAAYLLAGFCLFVAWDQWYWWTHREDYSFGFLVPVFVGYVLFERWPKIHAFLVGGRWAGAPATLEGGAGSRPARGLCAAVFGAAYALALLVFAFGALLRATQGVQNPASLSLAWGFAWLMLATVYFFSAETAGGERLRLGARLRFTAFFLFPAFIWLISAPLLNFLERSLSLFLLDKVTAVVFFIFDLLGVPIQKEGNVLLLGFLEGGGRNEVMVEDACSGIRSLMACLFAGSFLGAVFMEALWKKVLLVVLAMLFAFFTNILRSLFLTAYAYHYGADAIAGAVHDITGYAVLGLTCIGLIALLPLINFRYAFEETDADPPPAGASGTPS